MDEELKKDLKRLAKDTEVRLARSILAWKYKREGRPLPGDRQLERESREAAGQAREVITKRGRNVWNEFKKAYRKGEGKK